MTRSRVCCENLMPGVLLRMNETVACEQPAALAISVMVTRWPCAAGLRRLGPSTGWLSICVGSVILLIPIPPGECLATACRYGKGCAGPLIYKIRTVLISMNFSRSATEARQLRFELE